MTTTKLVIVFVIGMTLWYAATNPNVPSFGTCRNGGCGGPDILLNEANEALAPHDR